MGYNHHWYELICDAYHDPITFISRYPQLFDISRKGDVLFVSSHCDPLPDLYSYSKTATKVANLQVVYLESIYGKKELERVIDYSCVLLSQAMNKTMKSVTLANNIRDNLGVVSFPCPFHHRMPSR